MHIYSQPYEHADAKIVGNKEGLAKLALALTRAVLENKDTSTTEDVFATDGEGYEVKIIVLPDEYLIRDGQGVRIDPAWKEYPPHYCDRGYDDAFSL